MFYSWFNSIIKGYLKYRYGRIKDMQQNALQLQNQNLIQLLEKLALTEYGKQFNAGRIENSSDYAKALPIVKYEDIFPYIERMMYGEESVLWPGKVNCFAKSSGTTNDRSKFIPFTEEILNDNHVNASWDAMAILYHQRPEAKIFDKKNLLMGGSLSRFEGNKDVLTGDVSALLLSKMPAVGRPFYTPDFETAIMKDWESKIERMATACSNEDVTMFGGVPTWLIVLFDRILELTGKANMMEVWPNVRTYFHGGVGFDPYVDQFKSYFPSPDFQYYEVYNASEGYFAIQDEPEENGMLLLTDNATYYEFIPAEDIDNEHADVLTIESLEADRDYAIVISNASGLWRYMPGDLIRVVCLKPLRIKVCGRTKQYINAFGEELMVSNTDRAIREVCAMTSSSVREYTAAPIYMHHGVKGGHQWIIEFVKPPEDIKVFEALLDKQLRAINSDYDAKRTGDIALNPLTIEMVPPGTFLSWMAARGKLGGQNKVPRLSNNRKYLDEILTFISVQH